MFFFQKYGVKVTGIDLSTNMVCLAMERANQQPTSQVSSKTSKSQ